METRVLLRGLVAGLIAYVGVAALFAVLNLAMGQPWFHTAAQLGAVLVGDAQANGGMAAAPVIAYNGVHLLVMILLGIACSWLVHEWELHPQLGYAVFFALTVGAVVVTLLVGVYAAEFAHAAGWTTVVLANVLAAVLMAAYLVVSAHLKLPD